MKKTICLAGCLLLSVYMLHAQDEGVIKKKERIDRSKSVFLSLGAAGPFGKNIGDYSIGFSVEAGFLKRLNRILSVGPSISYSTFSYDQEKTGLNNVFVGGPYQDNQGDQFYEGLYFNLEGGKLSLLSLTLNLKLNFIPVKDNSIISVYAFAKPFIASVTRGEVTGKGTYLTNYGNINNSADWEVEQTFDWKAGADPFGIFKGSEDLKKQSDITGGIFIGPGVELFPARKISGFFQVAIGYTFPVSYISTKVYENDVKTGNDLDVFLEDIKDYPLTKKGFPSLNLQLGVSYNF